MINIVKNNKIGKVLFYACGVARIDNTVGIRADTGNLVGKGFMGKVCKKRNLYQINFCVQFLEPPFDVWLDTEIPLERDVPMLVVHKSYCFGQTVVK